MTTIPIHWAFNCRGNWDHGMMILAEEGKLADGFEHVKFPMVSRAGQRMVVCFNGNWVNKPEVREFLSHLRNCLVVSLSDEEGHFRPDMVHSSNVVWVQYGQPGKHDAAAKWLLTGMRCDTPSVIAHEMLSHQEPRLLWSFVGQTQNRTRKEMAAAVMSRTDGLLKVTDGFGGLKYDGMRYAEYIRVMLRSDFVLCPAGNVVADSFRFAEALECGACPVVLNESMSFWKRVCGDNIPACAREDWYDTGDWLDSHPHRHDKPELKFWLSYKRQFVQDIMDTVGRLQ